MSQLQSLNNLDMWRLYDPKTMFSLASVTKMIKSSEGDTEASSINTLLGKPPSG